MPEKVAFLAGDVVIRMSVSYPVNAMDTETLGLAARVRIDLSVPEPVRGVVRSEAQVRNYGRVFRETLDHLRKMMPACRRVHLFYAGPMALAFHVGQQISENIHPAVVVWNFSRGYEWGIDLAAAISGEPCVVRPSTNNPEGNE